MSSTSWWSPRPTGPTYRSRWPRWTPGLAVVVDKPLAATVADAEQLATAAARADVMATVFHNRRWDGDALTLSRLLDERALGQVHRFESRFERWRPQVKTESWRERPDPADAGGLLYDLGSHLIDQALHWFGPGAVGLRRAANGATRGARGRRRVRGVAPRRWRPVAPLGVSGRGRPGTPAARPRVGGVVREVGLGPAGGRTAARRVPSHPRLGRRAGAGVGAVGDTRRSAPRGDPAGRLPGLLRGGPRRTATRYRLLR